MAKSAFTRPGVFVDGNRLVRGEQSCHKRFEVGVVALTMLRDRAAEPVQVALDAVLYGCRPANDASAVAFSASLWMMKSG